MSLPSGFGGHPVSTVTVLPTKEPLTLAEGKLRAGLDWAADDPRDELMEAMIKAARLKWELDTGMALLTQTRVLRYDEVPPVLELIVRPLVSVESVTLANQDGTTTVVAPSFYTVDLDGSRIAFSDTVPSGARYFQPWAITVVAGYALPEDIPPAIIQALGTLVGYWATLGRDLASIDPVTETPYGWCDLVQPYLPMVLP